jgi:hypothetical protein
MRQVGRVTAFATATVAALICAAGAALPAHGWEAPTTLAPYTVETWSPSVAVDRDGDGLALWSGRPADDATDQHDIFVSGQLAGGGAWDPRTTLVPGADAVEPTLAGNAVGDALAAWVGDSDSAGGGVEIAQRDGATGAWGPVVDFAPLAEHGQSDPAVALADGGAAVLTWLEWNVETGSTNVRAATRRDGAWSAPVTLSDPDRYWFNGRYGAAIALDESGAARVLWEAYDTTDSTFHVQESRFDGSAWTPAGNVASSAEPIGGLSLDGDGRGRAVASWFVGGFPATLQTGVLVDGGWVTGDVSGDVAPACTPPGAVSIGRDGLATVAWQPDAGGLVTATGAGGAWSAPTRLYGAPEDTQVDQLVLSQAPGQEPAALWTTLNYDDFVFGALGSRRGAGGWQAPTTLASAGGPVVGPTLAMNEAGRALAGWAVTQNQWAKVQVAWSSAPQPPAPTPTPAAPHGGSPATPGGGRVLNPPFVRVRGGMLRLPRRGRVVSARLVNRDGAALRGTARLAAFFKRPAAGGPRLRTIALQRGLRVKVGGDSKLRLRLSAAAVQRLRAARRHSYPVRLYLTLRAPDGRTVRTTTTFTLDGWQRFGRGARPPVARKSC